MVLPVRLLLWVAALALEAAVLLAALGSKFFVARKLLCTRFGASGLERHVLCSATENAAKQGDSAGIPRSPITAAPDHTRAGPGACAGRGLLLQPVHYQ